MMLSTTAGADPGQHERGDVALPELVVEVGGGERTDPGLADGDVVRLPIEAFVELTVRGT